MALFHKGQVVGTYCLCSAFRVTVERSRKNPISVSHYISQHPRNVLIFFLLTIEKQNQFFSRVIVPLLFGKGILGPMQGWAFTEPQGRSQYSLLIW